MQVDYNHFYEKCEVNDDFDDELIINRSDLLELKAPPSGQAWQPTIALFGDMVIINYSDLMVDDNGLYRYNEYDSVDLVINYSDLMVDDNGLCR